MDWLLFVMIVAFVFWSFQIIVVYGRQVERYEAQIVQIQANTEEVLAQTEKYEVDHAEKKQELDELRDQARNLETKENEVNEKIQVLKVAVESMRPTRVRLDTTNSSSS